jgi:hypothetical protein
MGTVRVASCAAASPRSALGHNQIRTEPNQFCGVCALAVGIDGSPAMIYLDVFTCSPSQFMKLLKKRFAILNCLWIGLSNDP